MTGGISFGRIYFDCHSAGGTAIFSEPAARVPHPAPAKKNPGRQKKGSEPMSFEDRVNRRLKLWLARHPGVPEAEVKRKWKSIARRLQEEEDEEKGRT
jgi:hypothetical protein